MGPRSRAAASVLSRAGFKEVHAMQGGMNTWKGMPARGFPEVSIAFFPPDQTFEETIGVAWHLEEGTRRFYAEVSVMLADHKPGDLFRDLTAAEEKHKALLSSLYHELLEKEFQPAGFVSSMPLVGELDSTMEGGIHLSEALAWLPGKAAKDVLEFSLALETNAYDRYLTLAHNLEDEPSRRVLRALSREEKKHLERLTEVFEQLT
jgi:sulfur-carrier protein adenylyltransferase/sulfurtransferase